MTIEEKYKLYCQLPRAKRRAKWDRDTKQCGRCETYKHYTEYGWYFNSKRNGHRMQAICTECKRQHDRDYLDSLTPEEKQVRYYIANQKRYAAATARHCKYCGDRFTKKGRATYCSVACKTAKRQSAVYFRNCTDCGNLRTCRRKNTRPVDRCIDCAKVHQRQQKKRHKKNNTAHRLMTKVKRKTGYMAHVEKVDREKVFIMHKWCCAMCGTRTQKDDPNKPDAAELDHILPLSKGGSHTYSNVQLLCRRCNIAKGDKILKGNKFNTGGGSLSLFGAS